MRIEGGRVLTGIHAPGKKNTCVSVWPVRLTKTEHTEANVRMNKRTHTYTHTFTMCVVAFHIAFFFRLANPSYFTHTHTHTRAYAYTHLHSDTHKQTQASIPQPELPQNGVKMEIYSLRCDLPDGMAIPNLRQNAAACLNPTLCLHHLKSICQIN